MIGKVFGVISLTSFIWALVMGRGEELVCAVLDGASGAVTLTLSLCGMMCLWCGVMRIFEAAGLIGKVSRLLSPLLRLCFPMAYKSRTGVGEISANVSANLLGIGNAATPLALEAMRKLQSINPDKSTASADMITLAVLNTASFSVIPSTILALRRAAGSPTPHSVIVPIWIVSAACSLFALTLTALMRKASEKDRGRVAKK
ncbi:MAG: spore maturation protein [Clostridia bacterium]|nr:spore maturation protein [Clostridia bacterium]